MPRAPYKYPILIIDIDDWITKLKFCRSHDHVDRKDDPPRPAMTRQAGGLLVE